MSIPGSASPLFLTSAAAPAEFKIDRSLRFNSADSAYLSRTPASAGNRKTWTWSGWVKRSKVDGSYMGVFGAGGGSTRDRIQFFNNQKLVVNFNDGNDGGVQVSQVFRDPSAWYHIVVAIDTTQATASNRVKIYVNGSQVTAFDTATYPSQNYETRLNNNIATYIGQSSANDLYFDGYLAEVNFIDGQALDSTAFGEYDSNNVWQPKAYTGTYESFDNSQTWSDNITTTGNSGVWHSSYPATNAFNNNDSNYAHANANGSVAAVVTLTLNPAISCSSAVTFLGGVTSSGTGTIAINGGTATAFTTSATNPTAANTATASFTGDVSSIVITKTSTGANGLLVYGFEIDGKRLVDSGVSIASNSFHLKFADNSSNSALGTDSSGNSNTWTVNNLTADAGATGMPVSAAWTGYAGSTWSSTDTWDSLSDATTNFGNNSGTKGYSSITETWFGTKTNWTGAFGASIRGGNGWALKFSSTITITVNPVATSSIIACASTSTAVSAGTSYTSFPATMTGQVFWFQCTGSPSVGLYGSVGDIPDPSGIDSLIDTPTNYEADSGNNGGNYATLNPLNKHNTADTFSEGNLKLTSSGSGSAHIGRSTIAMSSGKYYWEVTWDDTSQNFAGIQGQSDINYNNSYVYLSNAKASANNGSSEGSSYGASWGNGDVIGIAYDADNATLTFYKNGVSQGTAFTNITGTYSPYPSGYVAFFGNWSGQACTFNVNFGQRPFVYAPGTSGGPSSDFKSLCTTNLPDPTIADGSTAFDTSIWSGNSTQDRKISTAFSPDFVWVKRRSASKPHILIDTIRGDDNYLHSSSTAANQVQANLLGLVSDGYELGTVESVNITGSTYVGWAWDGGSSNTTISAGSLNSSTYDQSQTWSSGMKTTSTANTSYSTTGRTTTFPDSLAATAPFDADLNNFLYSQTGVAGTWLYVEFGTALANVTSIIFSTEYSCPGGVIKLNGTDVAVDQSNLGGGFVEVSVTGTIPASLNEIAIQGNGGSARLKYLKINGKYLIDSGVTPANVPTIASTVRANPSAGFSIVSYTGNGTRGETVGHGLNAVPGFLIVKNRSTTVSSPAWGIKHSGLYFNSGYWMELETTDAAVAESASAGALFNATNPGPSVFTLGDRNTTNTNGDNYIAYCWAPVEGYSSFGRYTANGSADGPFVFTGFAVAWLMTKRTNASGSWEIHDLRRPGYNPQDERLLADSGTVEAGGNNVDLLSNGFKVRNSFSGMNNTNGDTYIYIAFAEHPFASNARAR